MTKTETYPWNIQDSLQTPDDIAFYLEAVFEDGAPSLIVAALGDIARSNGMTAMARRTEPGHQNHHKAQSPDGKATREG